MPADRNRRVASSSSPAVPPGGRRPLLVAFLSGAGLTVTAWAGWRTSRSQPVVPLRPATPIVAPPRIQGPGFQGKAGPWGVLEYTPIAIAPPRDLIKTDGEITPTRWVFPRHSRAQAERVLELTGIGQSELDHLRASGWKSRDGAVSVVPPPSLILGLAPEVRSTLYAILARYPENVQNAALAFRHDRLEARLAQSGLSPASIEAFRRLLYRRGGVVFFADDRTLLPMLEGSEERTRMVLLLAREDTYAVRLKIDSRTTVRQLLEYWGRPGRSKDIEPILSSLSGVPGGYALDLAHLLPAVPRRRIYTYPRRDNSGDEAKNCHWTSLNFFNEMPDDRFIDPSAAQAEVAAHYRPVEQPAFGDLVVLADAETGTVVHSATYLADDLVFTKNGFGLAEPWMYMQLAPMAQLYSLQLGRSDAIKILLYRRRTAPS